MSTDTSSDADYLFTYGILRRGLPYRVNSVLTRRAIFVGDGTFRGKLYDAGPYPGAVPSDEESDAVKGDVYALPDPEGVLEVLDLFEGCRPTGPGPEEFYRDRAPIRLDSGEEVVAWIYIYNWPTDGLQVIRSGDFANQSHMK